MSEISKQALKVDNTQSFPNNSTGYITPALLRAFNDNVIDSTVNQTVYTADSSSWNQQITALETFTGSQQPSFTALNAFTASQLTVNSGVNVFTQSANSSITQLNAATASLQNFTSSINQIIVNGSSIGTSTRFFFNGFVSASIIPNVDGAIASITVLSDGSKLNTGSFNAYTASTAASQSLFSASVSTSLTNLNSFTASQNTFNSSATASIQELLNLSSSLSGGYATQGELDYSSSVLQANIDTKLNTSSFNAYTQSITQAGYATTGSNSFNGNQNITGSITVSGNTNITPASVSTNANYVIPFISGSTISKDSVDTLFYNPSSNQLLVSASTGQSNINPNLISFSSGSGTSQYSSTLSKNAFTQVSSPGYYISLSGNPSQIGAPSLTNSTKPALLALSSSGQPYATIELQNSQSFTDGRVTAKRLLVAESGLDVSGSLTITGSVYQNVNAVTIASSTASIDLSVANYFTLTLSGSTNINVTNPRPGVTATLVITTDTGASASFSSNVMPSPNILWR